MTSDYPEEQMIAPRALDGKTKNSPEHGRQHGIRFPAERVVGEVRHHEGPQDGYLPRHPYPHVYRRDGVAGSSPLGSVEIHFCQTRIRVQDDALRDNGSIHEQLSQLSQLRLESLHVCERDGCVGF